MRLQAYCIIYHNRYDGVHSAANGPPIAAATAVGGSTPHAAAAPQAPRRAASAA